MRLLNTTTLELESFLDIVIPPYAILSHVWGPAKDEVSFEDMQTGSAKHKPGYTKLEKASLVAASQGFGYIWIDTCCIRQSSSSELSEAINSMFRYYQNSEVCYAFLADVATTGSKEGFAQSKWFTRGWTLQELIAPTSLNFLSNEWVKIGTRVELAVDIAAITNISPAVLEDRTQLRFASVAKRMSWASNRTTTREEDIAYSLMGIFDVNMPLLYGEGSKAFRRLQEEIMRSSTDQSLFAWTPPISRNYSERNHMSSLDLGFLARHPEDFSQSSNIVPYQSKSTYSLANKGLHITLPITPLTSISDVAILACHREGDFHSPLGIRVIRVPDVGTDQSFLRQFENVESSLVESKDFRLTYRHVLWQHAKPRSVYILKERVQDTQIESYAWIRTYPSDSHNLEFTARPYGNGSWDHTTSTLTWTGAFRSLAKSQDLATLGSITVASKDSQTFSGVVGHLGVYRKLVEHSYEVQPCIHLGQTQPTPRWDLFTRSCPPQFSRRLSRDWLMVTNTKFFCASVKSELMMDKRISVIDVWTVDLKDFIKTLLVLAALLWQSRQLAALVWKIPAIHDYLTNLSWAQIGIAWAAFNKFHDKLWWPWLFLVVVRTLRGEDTLMSAWKSTVYGAGKVTSTTRSMDRSFFWLAWQWTSIKLVGLPESVLWSVFFSNSSTSLRKFFTVRRSIVFLTVLRALIPLVWHYVPIQITLLWSIKEGETKRTPCEHDCVI